MILIWGTTYISTKVLLVDFTSIEILFYRFSVGFLTLLIIYPHHVKTGGLQAELLYVDAGLSSVSLFFLLENIALTYTLALHDTCVIRRRHSTRFYSIWGPVKFIQFGYSRLCRFCIVLCDLELVRWRARSSEDQFVHLFGTLDYACSSRHLLT